MIREKNAATQNAKRSICGIPTIKDNERTCRRIGRHIKDGGLSLLDYVTYDRQNITHEVTGAKIRPKRQKTI